MIRICYFRDFIIDSNIIFAQLTYVPLIRTGAPTDIRSSKYAQVVGHAFELATLHTHPPTTTGMAQGHSTQVYASLNYRILMQRPSGQTMLEHRIPLPQYALYVLSFNVYFSVQGHYKYT